MQRNLVKTLSKNIKILEGHVGTLWRVLSSITFGQNLTDIGTRKKLIQCYVGPKTLMEI